MSLLKLGVIKQHKNSNSSFIRVKAICFTLRKINFKICYGEKLLAEHSTICVIPENVWTNTQKFIALATLLAALRYTSYPSAQQQWKYRNW